MRKGGSSTKNLQYYCEQLQKQYQLDSYPVEIVQLCNKFGFSVYEQYLPHGWYSFWGIGDELLSKYKSSKIIVVNLAFPPTERRFLIAQELSYYLLQEKVKTPVFAHKTSKISRKDTKEKEAEELAARLLIPKKFLRQVLLVADQMYLLPQEKEEFVARQFKVEPKRVAYRIKLKEE